MLIQGSQLHQPSAGVLQTHGHASWTCGVGKSPSWGFSLIGPCRSHWDALSQPHLTWVLLSWHMRMNWGPVMPRMSFSLATLGELARIEVLNVNTFKALERATQRGCGIFVLRGF